MVVNEFKGNLTAVVRSVVLEAWRQRWAEDRWSIAMKTYLPYIDATDPLLLSNIILEQTVISASPNFKLLDYLSYAIHSEMTLFSSTVQSIIAYKDISQPYCLSALVSFLAKVYNCPFTSGSREDPVELSKSLMQIKVWLFELALKALQKLNEPKCQTEIFEEILRSCSQILVKMSQHDVSNSLVCLSLSDPDPDQPQQQPTSSSSLLSSNQRTYSHKLEHLSTEIGRLLCQPFNQPISDATRQALVVGTKFDSSISGGHVTPPCQLLERSDLLLNLTTNIMVVMETYLFPCNDMQVLAEKLIVQEQLMGMIRPQLHSEILRSCYLGLLDDDIKSEDIKWSTFVYIRVPSLFLKLLPSSSSDDKQAELCSGIEHFLETPLILDAVDSKCNSDCLQFLVSEFAKYSLLTEAQVKKIMAKRQASSMRLKSSDNTSQHPAHLIVKAEPTLITILKSLDAQKIPEMSLRVMNPLMCGKSFELVSSVAAATGKLQIFVGRLIRINEMSKMPLVGEPPKNSQIRATVFDISFLHLCHIVQIYNLEVVSSCSECKSTFFYQWATRCLPDGGKIRPADNHHQLSSPYDKTKLEQFLEQLAGDSEFKFRFDDACLMVPTIIQELIWAWKQKGVDKEFVKSVLDSVKSTMCSLAVVASTWLCNHIAIAGTNDSMEAEKFVLQHLSNYNTNEVGNNNNNYHERSYLARQFINYLISRVEPDLLPETGHTYAHTMYTLPSHDFHATIQGRKEKLMEIFHEIHLSGCLKVGNLLLLERIYELSACSWFAQSVVEAMLSYVTPGDLMRGICIAHALFQIDPEELTVCLLQTIVPTMLSGSDGKYMSEHYVSAVIKLVVMSMATISRMKLAIKDTEYKSMRRRRKRSEYLAENVDESVTDLEKPFKLKRDDDNGEGPSISLNDNFLLGDVICNQEHFSNPHLPSNILTSGPVRDHLSKPLVTLLSLFYGILTDVNTGPQMYFVLKFIMEILKSGTVTARFVLQHSPPNLAQLVAKFMHRELLMEHIFMFGDITTTSGRETIAKAIYQTVKQKSAETNYSTQLYA